MNIIEKDIKINNPQGLHARPAALFVQIVSKYDVNVTIEKDGEKINGKSIMGILTLGAQQHTMLKLTIEGDDCQIVMNELEQLLNSETLG